MNRTRLLLPASAVVLGLFALACGPDPAEATPIETSEVAVEDNVFTPIAVSVAAGTTVTWTWEGDADHNVVGEDFTSDTQSEGTFEYRFDEAGSYEYRCTLHGGMRGRVVVTDAE